MVAVASGYHIYMTGRCLITSSSSTGQGAGTKFSEKSHFIVLRWVEGPRLGHFLGKLNNDGGGVKEAPTWEREKQGRRE